ncbi:MAG: RnfABCDGE type electron transport complex subunit B [Caldisericia bacterium]|nr:RnfABCDGE type electron transport complex subunit B [Caldisericia bacterium]
MSIQIIIYSVVVLLCLGLLFGLMLGVFSKVFHVKEDPKVEEIKEVLPGANCGACGYSGCTVYAEAVVQGKATCSGCIAGGQDTADKIASIMGTSTSGNISRNVAVVLCKGGKEESVKNAISKGASSCKMANQLRLYDRVCRYGCVGFGDCVEACTFDAIHIGEKGLPIVDNNLCTGCGQCVEACPRNIIKLFTYTKRVLTLCSNSDTGSMVRKACKVGCISCGICIKKCPQKAIVFKDNIPVIDIDKCDLCGICITVCPVNALSLRLALSEKDE